MSKFSRRLTDFGKSGTVTVIGAQVHRSSARNAKLAFWVTLFIVGLLAATVAADRIHPILALFVGALIGVAAGLAMWALVRSWPVIRLLWWWLFEISLGLTVVYGWTSLARHTPTLVRLLVVALLVGMPVAVPVLRRRIIALSWCVIVRHRLRTCFAQFIISNRSGSLPLILLARPTPVGERVWIYLRPGLSLPELESRLDKMAVACHACNIVVKRASETNSAYIRIDIKRRNALTATVASPLTDLVDPNTPPADRKATTVSTALDLPDVSTTTAAAAPTQRANTNGRKPATSAAVATATVDEDLSDWL